MSSSLFDLPEELNEVILISYNMISPPTPLPPRKTRKHCKQVADVRWFLIFFFLFSGVLCLGTHADG